MDSAVLSSTAEKPKKQRAPRRKNRDTNGESVVSFKSVDTSESFKSVEDSSPSWSLPDMPESLLDEVSKRITRSATKGPKAENMDSKTSLSVEADDSSAPDTESKMATKSDAILICKVPLKDMSPSLRKAEGGSDGALKLGYYLSEGGKIISSNSKSSSSSPTVSRTPLSPSTSFETPIPPTMSLLSPVAGASTRADSTDLTGPKDSDVLLSNTEPIVSIDYNEPMEHLSYASKRRRNACSTKESSGKDSTTTVRRSSKENKRKDPNKPSDGQISSGSSIGNPDATLGENYAGRIRGSSDSDGAIGSDESRDCDLSGDEQRKRSKFMRQEGSPIEENENPVTATKRHIRTIFSDIDKSKNVKGPSLITSKMLLKSWILLLAKCLVSLRQMKCADSGLTKID
ncbi:unnamed protein product [Diatraea saccharalis]|uniref:Uncharacterized protein n=1 Tax=Diatraea saccharalis TaxID=40085 RepID=A0A9N9R6F4_9NEOP|nr:unnamed protein product [Diatraea saccharalis]